MAGLRRHIPELAVEWALDEPQRPWLAVDGTLCFADISGFTALSEKLSRRGRIGGEELVETLSRVFGGMLDAAAARDGMLLKFGGDALLFLFRGEDHARRAASTAVDMRNALRRARAIPTSVGPLSLSMSVGLHSGLLHFFLVGSRHRELVLAGGDASQAAEVESAAQAGEIGLSAATAALLPASAVRLRDDGLRLLRWRKAPLPAAGAHPPRPADEDVVRGLFPRSLGEVLARGRPEAEHRMACIAFVRFSGTDALLADKGPDAVADALQRTLSTAMDVFADEEVTLLAVDLDRDGGKLFLGTGVPQASEDDEGRMLRALTRLVAAGTPLPLQAGVNRGHVFVAEVGTEHRAAYSAMGDTTNTAARICAKAPPGVVYAHPAVLTHARAQYATRPAGPFQFKGKRVPLVVYEVGEEVAPAAALAAASHVLVDRDHEIERLSVAVDALASGVGGVVTITGPAGIGKSRLLREAVGRLAGLPILELRAEIYGRNSPYRVFRDPLRSLLGIQRGEAADMRAQLQAAVIRADALLAPWLGLLGDVVHVDVPPSPEAAAIEPRFRQDRLADTLVRLLDAMHDGPRVITMEDAQWADGASAHLLGRLADAAAQRPWLMLVTRRDEAGGFAPATGEQLPLGPLSAAAMATLVNEVTSAAPLRPHELQLVVRRAGGNPLYAEELVRAARSAGSFEAVPESLEAAMAAQVDALDAEARRALRYATVLGRSFGKASLEGLLATEGLSVDEALLSRVEEFLEPDGDDRLRFRLGLLRKAIYEGLAYRLRTRLHREAGEAMERRGGDLAPVADNLAMHFSLAGDHPRAWRYALMAAERATRAYANADAARLYQLALEAARRLPDLPDGERLRALIARGDACRLAGMYEECLDTYREAYRVAGDDRLTRAEMLRLRARARERAGAFPAALRDLTTGRHLLDGVEGPGVEAARARLGALAAMVRFGQERFDAAIRLGLKAADRARQTGETEALAEALVAAGSAELSIGADGAGRMREALALYQQLGDLSGEAMVRGNLGAGAFLEGRWDEALEWFEGDRQARMKAGNPVGAATAASNCGEIYVKQGRAAEAEPLLRDAVRVMRAAGFHDGAAYAEVQLGRVLLARGAARQADELLGRAREELDGFGRRTSAGEAALVQALARVRLGDAAGALDIIDTSVMQGGMSELLAPQVAESRAMALAALGRLDEAEATLEAGLEVARRRSLAYEEGCLLRCRSEIRTASGLAPDAADQARAADLLGALGVRLTPNAPDSIAG